jgi:hypothetical protein
MLLALQQLDVPPARDRVREARVEVGMPEEPFVVGEHVRAGRVRRREPRAEAAVPDELALPPDPLVEAERLRVGGRPERVGHGLM